MRYTLVELTKQTSICHHRLRFGEPVFQIKTDKRTFYAVFEPGQIFGYIRWRKNDYGTVHWQLVICQAWGSDLMQAYPGIHPGVDILLRARGVKAVKETLEWIDKLECNSAKPLSEIPKYFWRKAANAKLIRAKLPRFKSRKLEPFHV